MPYKFGEVTTLAYDRETYLRDRLKQLLEFMETAPRSTTVEYGDPTQMPGSYMSYIRISRMNTFGIKQFRTCELQNGTEGGGAYHPSVEASLHWSMLLVRHYHRPSPFQEFLKKRVRPQLDWFSFDASVQKALPILALANTDARNLPPDGVTVDLTNGQD